MGIIRCIRAQLYEGDEARDIAAGGQNSVASNGWLSCATCQSNVTHGNHWIYRTHAGGTVARQLNVSTVVHFLVGRGYLLRNVLAVDSGE